MKKSKGEEYINAFPKFKKWINECTACHYKGYNPNMPDQIDPIEGSLGSYFIKKYFKPLKLDNNGLCEQCSKCSTQNHAVASSNKKNIHYNGKSKMSWEDFLERYLTYGEEFILKYKCIEYHLAFYDKEDKIKAEFNIGTQEDGYVNLEYPSAEILLENAKIDGKSIQEIWTDLVVE
mgnify:CR=1 FL=1